MSSFPTPPLPPPPPPFYSMGAPMQAVPPGTELAASTQAPGPSSGPLQPPPPAPGVSPYPMYAPSPAVGHAPATSPFAIALPGHGQPSSALHGSGVHGIPQLPTPSLPSGAMSPPLILPLGPPPPGPNSSRRGTVGAGKGPTGRGRQTKSTSVDPGQGDEDLLPPATPAGIDGPRQEEDDAEDEGEELGDDDELESMEARARTRRENMPYLIEAMTPEQLDRHDAFRRHSLNRGSVKRLLNQVLSQSVTDNVALVAGGAAKIFIGEIVEKARQVQLDQAKGNPTEADLGPLRPEHIVEAHRLYTLERDRPGRLPPAGGAPGVGKRRRLF